MATAKKKDAQGLGCLVQLGILVVAFVLLQLVVVPVYNALDNAFDIRVTDLTKQPRPEWRLLLAVEARQPDGAVKREVRRWFEPTKPFPLAAGETLRLSVREARYPDDAELKPKFRGSVMFSVIDEGPDWQVVEVPTSGAMWMGRTRYRVEKGVVTPITYRHTTILTFLVQLGVAYLFVWLIVRLIWRGVKARPGTAPPESPT
jgi:hypothetical protein